MFKSDKWPNRTANAVSYALGLCGHSDWFLRVNKLRCSAAIVVFRASIANPSKHQGMILVKTDHQFSFLNYSMELFGVVTVDKDLTFKQHVSSICKRVNNQFSVMTRFGKLI